MTTPTPAAQKAAQMIEALEARDCPGYVEAIAAIIDREMNQWIPIADAPRDRTWIVGMWPSVEDRAGETGERQEVVRFEPNFQIWENFDYETFTEPTHFRYIIPPCPATAKP